MPAQQQFSTLGSRAVKGLFFEELEAVESWSSNIAAEFGSDQDVETYAGLTNVPMPREWIGGRQAKQMAQRSLTITNKDWEATLAIATKDLRRDKTDQIRARIAALAQGAARHKEKLLSDYIAAGAASTYGYAYTGATTTFFSSTHSYGDSTNDNTIDVDISALPVGDTTGAHGSTTAPSVGEMALAIQAGCQQLFGFVDSEGQPINQSLRSFVIMVPTTLWGVAKTAVNGASMAQGMTNPLIGDGMSYKVVPNARLNSSWTTKFAVFADGGLIRPFIVQTEVPLTLDVLAEGSDYEFDNKAHKYSASWVGNVGYWAPDKACLVTLT